MIRIGMLGADSSHTETYIGLMNSPASPYFGRAKVVKLWGEDGRQAREKAMEGVVVVESPDEAIQEVDLVMVCSRWGEDHPPLALLAIEAGVPTYIDKPLANNLNEAKKIAAAAASKKVPAFSCSPYRYASEVQDLRKRTMMLGEFRSGVCAGLSEYPALGPRAQNIFFYGVHPAEMIHAVFGPGMDAVRIESGRNTRIATIRYKNGSQVGLHLLRDCEEVYHLAYYGSKGWVQRAIDTSGAFYQATLAAILSMAENGEAPVPLNYAVEVIALLQAIEQATANGGWVKLER